MRIVIVEDSALVRDNLLALLAGHPSLAVIGTAAGEDEAYELITRTRPDTVLLDLALSPGSGLSLLHKLRATAGLGPRVVILSNQPADPYEALCRDAGADAFFDKCGELSGLLAQLASWMPPLPPNELERLSRLTRLQVLDAPAEVSFDTIARIAAARTHAP
ncbi:MAG: response regulator transcription factor, partial [Thauera sp.]|nr:response regulator transcription factor [Thauera sp.]